jgi:hypothetical protein
VTVVGAAISRFIAKTFVDFHRTSPNQKLIETVFLLILAKQEQSPVLNPTTEKRSKDTREGILKQTVDGQQPGRMPQTET